MGKVDTFQTRVVTRCLNEEITQPVFTIFPHTLFCFSTSCLFSQESGKVFTQKCHTLVQNTSRLRCMGFDFQNYGDECYKDDLHYDWQLTETNSVNKVNPSIFNSAYLIRFMSGLESIPADWVRCPGRFTSQSWLHKPNLLSYLLERVKQIFT